MKRFGLRAKFILLIAVLLLILFAAITLILVRQNSKNLHSDLNTQSKLFGYLATKPIGDTFLVYHDSGQIQILQQIQNFTDLDPNVTNVAIVDTAGKVQFNQHPNQSVSLDPTSAASFDPIYVNDKGGNIQEIVQPFIEDTGAHRYNLVYSVSSASVQALISQTVTSIVVFSFLGLLVSILITYLLISRLFLRPIQHVSSQALTISSGQLEQQVQVARNDEIGDLANAVNTMANALKADIQKLREVDALKSEFMMISSHNLRTPLSVIQGYLELLGNMKLNRETSEMVNIVAANAQRLNVFSEDMLVISQMEAGQTEAVDKKPTPLKPFIETLASEFKTLAVAKHIKADITIPTNLPTANIQERRLRDALWNILDNALKFTPEKGNIHFSITSAASVVTIKVTDSGIGIAPEEMSKLFTKFHRGTSTLEYNYEGTGIGLYLAKLIIEQHGGTINMTSQLGHGTTATITLPV